MMQLPNKHEGVRPLVLDFDASVLPPAMEELRIPLGDWQESIRFGCTRRTYARLENHLAAVLPPGYGCVFTGSGDYHHVSLLLLRRLALRAQLPPASLDLVICDNHPDNMRYPFGLHCGSWVCHAARLACVRQVHVVGVTSPDIATPHCWENYWGPLLRRKLSYWSVGRKASWLRFLGRGEQGRSFSSASALVEAFLPVLGAAKALYLSLDKDVFSPEVVRTNWDQGVFEPAQVETLIAACAGKLAGADITGELSAYAYAGRFKRLLSRLDGQSTAPPDQKTMRVCRAVQQELNSRLLARITASMA